MANEPAERRRVNPSIANLFLLNYEVVNRRNLLDSLSVNVRLIQKLLAEVAALYQHTKDVFESKVRLLDVHRNV
jgi:hypothetical protein